VHSCCSSILGSWMVLYLVNGALLCAEHVATNKFHQPLFPDWKATLKEIRGGRFTRFLCTLNIFVIA